MILTTHALVGAVIGSQFSSLWIIIPSSIIVHYAMDGLRHGEYLNQNSSIGDTIGKVAIDISIGLILIFGIVFLKRADWSQTILILVGAFFSIFPDLLTFIYWKIIPSKILEIIYRFHARMHSSPPFSSEREWTLKNARNDILISILALLILAITL